jgi:hypothetical protein
MVLGISWKESISMDYEFYFYSSSCNTYGTSIPSSHEMRYKPSLGLMYPKKQNIRNWKGRSMESGKCDCEWYDDPSRKPTDRNHFPEGDQLTRIQCQPPR